MGLIQDKEKYIDKSEAILSGNINNFQDQIYQAIVGAVSDFDTVGGRLTNSPENIRLLAQVEERVRLLIYQTDYPTKVSEYVRTFRSLPEINAAIQRSINGLDISALNVTNIQNQVIESTVYELLGQGMNVNLINPVKNQLTLSLYTGSNVSSFERYLDDFVKKANDVTNPIKVGNINVGQIATDAIGQYDGTIQSIIMNQFELDYWGYEGSLIKTSRPQCRRWVEMGKIPVGEVQSEIEWALRNGSGMIPGTTPETFGSFRGGYNCRHRATPLRKID